MARGIYAANTTVDPERSRQEIEKTLRRYGADSFVYGWEKTRGVLMFRVHGKMVRFEVAAPTDAEIGEAARAARRRTREDVEDQIVRQRWRVLVIAIKAKLEVVQSGLASFDQEFLAHFLLPSGETFGAWGIPQLERAYKTGRMPTPLAMLTGPRVGAVEEEES